MKFMRILAVLMAAMLCLTACSMIEEAPDSDATAAPTAAPAENTAAEATDGPMAASNQAVLIGSLGMPYESWMTADMYAAFAATFLVDMSYVNAFDINTLNTELGIPTVYVGELQGDNYGNGMNLVLFYTHPETSAVTMLNSTVYLKTALFEGYVQENIADVTATMDGFVTDGVLQVYHEVSYDAFMTAYAGLSQVISSLTSSAAAE